MGTLGSLRSCGPREEEEEVEEELGSVVELEFLEIWQMNRLRGQVAGWPPTRACLPTTSRDWSWLCLPASSLGPASL